MDFIKEWLITYFLLVLGLAAFAGMAFVTIKIADWLSNYMDEFPAVVVSVLILMFFVIGIAMYWVEKCQ